MNEIKNKKVSNDDPHYLPDLILKNIEKDIAIKSDFYIAHSNFQSIIKYLGRVRDLINELFNTLNIEEIIAEIIKRYESSKNTILISFDLDIGSITVVKVGDRRFQIKRVDEYLIEITCIEKEPWKVDALIIQVKNAEGMIVYPRIITINSKVTIDFIDSISSNYWIYFI